MFRLADERFTAPSSSEMGDMAMAAENEAEPFERMRSPSKAGVRNADATGPSAPSGDQPPG